MSNKRKIAVTQWHIDNAIERDCHNCVIRLAAVDAIPNSSYCRVQLNKISINRKGQKYREAAFLPPIANNALILLDSGRRDEIKPFTFWIDLVKTSKIVHSTPARMVKVLGDRKLKGSRPRKTVRVSGVAVRNYQENFLGDKSTSSTRT